MIPKICRIFMAITLLAAGQAARADIYTNTQAWAKGWRDSTIAVAPTRDKSYQDQCGTCHFAYPPGLLPARSWERILTNLHTGQHFGAAVAINPQAFTGISRYLEGDAADYSDHWASIEIRTAIDDGATPLRITELSFFKEKHRAVPPEAVTGNPGIRSFSYCDRCHPRAAKGGYNPHEVIIPGQGFWKD